MNFFRVFIVFGMLVVSANAMAYSSFFSGFNSVENAKNGKAYRDLAESQARLNDQVAEVKKQQAEMLKEQRELEAELKKHSH